MHGQYEVGIAQSQRSRGIRIMKQVIEQNQAKGSRVGNTGVDYSINGRLGWQHFWDRMRSAEANIHLAPFTYRIPGFLLAELLGGRTTVPCERTSPGEGQDAVSAKGPATARPSRWYRSRITAVV